jgi:toluene monooxygenase system ferredoxin subunit
MSARKVATLDEVWAGEKLGIEVDHRRILIVNVDGVVCAYEDRCRHKGVRLSEGHLDGCVLTCAAHGWQYDASTGLGINPQGVALPRYEVTVVGDDIMVELPEGAERSEAEHEANLDARDWVGPVLQKGDMTEVVVAAIRELNAGARVVDRGAYVRVLAHRRCHVTREAIERRSGGPFRLPSDLELIMSSFKGKLDVSEEEAVWQVR